MDGQEVRFSGNQVKSSGSVRKKIPETADSDTGYVGIDKYHVNYCGRENCRSGHAYGPAVRSAYLLHLIRNGKGLYTVKGATYPVHKDQAFLIYPGDRVYYEADRDDPWHYDWIAFSGNGIEECVTQMGFNEKRYVITVKRTHELSDCVTKILNTRRQTLTNELLRTAELLRFFAIIIGDQQPEPNRPTDQDWGPSTIRPITKNGSSYVQQAVEYMVANYNQPFRIGELADLIGINRSHLTTRFRKEANMPPAEFLMQLRMDKAESLLRETTFSITEIANMIGYTDALAFSKMFRKRHGVSPRQYRSEAKATRQTNR